MWNHDIDPTWLGSTGQMNLVDIDEDLAKIMLKLEPNRIEGETLSEF